jgi:hypothetical protein
MDEIYTFLVRGSSSRLPRGYIWLIPVWFAVLGLVVVLVSRHASGSLPLWLGVAEIGGMLLAAVILIAVLATVRRHAFRANSHGIWLGVRTTRKRPKLRQVHIVWADVAQMRMVARSYGVLLEITLGPAARIVHRPGPARQALRLLGSLVMPVGFGRGTPGLTAARADPPRYLIKICDVTPKELRLALAAVKPDTLPVLQLAQKGTLRFAIPPPRKPAAARPVRPTVTR